MASRATCLTGRTERSHECNFYYRDLAKAHWDESYPVLLRKAGYQTGFIGKFGVKVKGYSEGLPESDFDRFYAFQGQGSYFPKGKKGPHSSSGMADQAIDFLKKSQSRKQPFCLSISFKAPHLPLNPDPVYKDLYKNIIPYEPGPKPKNELAGLPSAYSDAAWYPRLVWQSSMSSTSKRHEFIRGRYRLIAGVDAAIGRIRTTLKEMGLSENTVIIFASDNGYFYGEHGLATKFYMHEESVRIPLIIYDPRLDAGRQGQFSSHLVSNIDIAPTICELGGITIPKTMQGRSLLSLINDSSSGWRDAVFCENIVKERRPMCDAIITRDWKYISLFEQEPVQEELYHLKEDPYENVNLIGNNVYEEKRKELQQRLQEMRIHYSDDPTGFPQWIKTQKENANNWKGYRNRYLKIKEKIKKKD